MTVVQQLGPDVARMLRNHRTSQRCHVNPRHRLYSQWYGGNVYLVCLRCGRVEMEMGTFEMWVGPEPR